MARKISRNLAWMGLGFALGIVPTLFDGTAALRWAELMHATLATPALAAEPTTFTDSAFQAAQQAGKPILVHVNASWCPTCARQRPILDKLEHSAELGDLTVFTVDFDSQKDALHEFNVQQQSTLIVFNGKTEKGRATGITDPDAIRNLLLQAKRP
ncbi:MAG TPA: thioredoxin family protein [Dongiaceae bacterium]|nr:thioredoxin family protein [Dongiaceae bacterium]